MSSKTRITPVLVKPSRFNEHGGHIMVSGVLPVKRTEYVAEVFIRHKGCLHESSSRGVAFSSLGAMSATDTKMVIRILTQAVQECESVQPFDTVHVTGECATSMGPRGIVQSRSVSRKIDPGISTPGEPGAMVMINGKGPVFLLDSEMSRVLT